MAKLALDYRALALDAADRAMLDFAVALTRRPHDVSAHGAADLRAEGFSDAAILDVCQVTAYYNYVNRLAEGLDVTLEDYWKEENLTMSRATFDARLREHGSR